VDQYISVENHIQMINHKFGMLRYQER
jgi:hypothetical protein